MEVYKKCSRSIRKVKYIKAFSVVFKAEIVRKKTIINSIFSGILNLIKLNA